MVKYLVEVVQALFVTGMFCALVFAVPFALKNERSKKITLWGFVASFALALVLAYVKERALVRKFRYINLVLLGIAIFFGLAYCIMRWFSGKKQKSAVFNTLFCACGVLFCAALINFYLPDVIRMPLRFVWTDQGIWNTEFLAKLTGYLFGLLAVYLTALAIFKISLSIQARYTTVFLSLLFVTNVTALVANALSVFIRYRMVKVPVSVGNVILALVNHESTMFYLSAAWTICYALVWFLYNVRIHGEYTNPAEHRLLRAFARNGRRWSGLLLCCAVFAVLDVTVIYKLSQQVVVLSPSESYEFADGVLYIPLTQVSDMHLHRFTHTAADGNDVRFIIVQKQGSAFGVGFDACEICGATGYYERNDEIVCNRCDVVMNRNTIGYKGGCNPIPLAYTIKDGNVVIQASDLDAESKRFR